MRKLVIYLSLTTLPFMLIWAGFILTGFNFNPHKVFNTSFFWAFSCMYWFVYISLSPFIIENLDEVFK